MRLAVASSQKETIKITDHSATFLLEIISGTHRRASAENTASLKQIIVDLDGGGGAHLALL